MEHFQQQMDLFNQVVLLEMQLVLLVLIQHIGRLMRKSVLGLFTSLVFIGWCVSQSTMRNIPILPVIPTIFVSSCPFTVPSNWNSANNTIEVIGAGGGGGSSVHSSNAGAGGGGGAYSKSVNVTLTP